MTTNPLSEANPQSLAELFNDDPFNYIKSASNRARIIEELRRARATWDKAKAGGAKRAPKAQFTLDDL